MWAEGKSSQDMRFCFACKLFCYCNALYQYNQVLYHYQFCFFSYFFILFGNMFADFHGLHCFQAGNGRSAGRSQVPGLVLRYFEGRTPLETCENPCHRPEKGGNRRFCHYVVAKNRKQFFCCAKTRTLQHNAEGCTETSMQQN